MESLIIIDMQEGYIGNRRNEKIFNQVVEHIKYVASLFIKAGKPVIFVRDIEEGDTEEFLNIKEFQNIKYDKEILKVHNNSFWKTKLEDILKEMNVNMTVICGNTGEYCVSATYFGALERGFKPVLLQNGILSESKSGAISLLETKPFVSHQALSYWL
jgi:nicotinamidase-related amidase